MRRFLFDPEMQRGDLVRLTDEESFHISRVLRLLPGAAVELMDGKGGVYTAVIAETGKSVLVRMVDRRTEEDPGRVPLWVGQGLLKGKKMDTTIQHCTELGVTRFIPFHSSRCQGSLREQRERQRTERWDRIVVSACKQCKRADLMAVEELQDLQAVLTRETADQAGLLKLMFWEEEREFRLRPEMMDREKVGKIMVLIGPEGGFSAAEVALARDCGWQTVSLGHLVLRAETATLAAVSLVQHLSGNM